MHVTSSAEQSMIQLREAVNAEDARVSQIHWLMSRRLEVNPLFDVHTVDVVGNGH